MENAYQEIQNILKEIETKNNVKILLAVESGSRAWGFASPDSDYDVRFIYIREPKEYLRLDNTSDIIEWQLDDILDINGWDLKKALMQFYRSNATLFEWSNSPIIYHKAPEWDAVYDVAKSYFSSKAAIYHYYGTAKNTYLQYLQDEDVRYKKYFYALRPLLACSYIEANNTPPPVLFDDLNVPPYTDSIHEELEELLEIKKITGESVHSPHFPAILSFISSELPRHKEIVNALSEERKKSWTELNQVFLNVLNSIWR